jgi:hypothetical protein
VEGGVKVTLTEQQKDYWEDNDYLAMAGVVPPSEVDRLRQSADAIEAQAAGLSESTDRFALKSFGGDSNLPAALLARLQPHRASFLQAKELPKSSVRW